MSDYKDKVTRGRWKGVGENGCYDNRRNDWELVNDDTDEATSAPITLDDGKVIAFVVCEESGPDADAEFDANAQLIAEAGTVLHETGYTPRELAEQRAELLAALKKIDFDWDGEPEDMFAARAAIARCEAAQ
jgi:hypothetical protein